MARDHGRHIYGIVEMEGDTALAPLALGDTEGEVEGASVEKGAEKAEPLESDAAEADPADEESGEKKGRRKKKKKK